MLKVGQKIRFNDKIYIVENVKNDNILLSNNNVSNWMSFKEIKNNLEKIVFKQPFNLSETFYKLNEKLSNSSVFENNYTKVIARDIEVDNNFVFYHGSDVKNIKVFNTPEIFWTTDKEFAKSWGEYIYTAHLNLGKVFDLNNRNDFDFLISKVGKLKYEDENNEFQFIKTWQDYINADVKYDNWDIIEEHTKIIKKFYNSMIVYEFGTKNYAVFSNDQVSLIGTPTLRNLDEGWVKRKSEFANSGIFYDNDYIDFEEGMSYVDENNVKWTIIKTKGEGDDKFLSVESENGQHDIISQDILNIDIFDLDKVRPIFDNRFFTKDDIKRAQELLSEGQKFSEIVIYLDGKRYRKIYETFKNDAIHIFTSRFKYFNQLLPKALKKDGFLEESIFHASQWKDKQGDDVFFTILKNPSKKEFWNEFNDSKTKQLRGLVGVHNNSNLYVWDAYYGTHNDIYDHFLKGKDNNLDKAFAQLVFNKNNIQEFGFSKDFNKIEEKYYNKKLSEPVSDEVWNKLYADDDLGLLEAFDNKVSDKDIETFGKILKTHNQMVNKYAAKVGKSYPNHDREKLKKAFLYPYTNGYVKGEDNLSENDKTLYKNAQNKHYKESDHHCEHWGEVNNDGMVDVSGKMPDEALIEMCADWCAQSEKYGNTPFQWAKKVIDRKWRFDDHQKNIIHNTLKQMWDDAIKPINETVVYAGSSKDYEKPSLVAINSGEGNQAHGWGLYYTVNKEVAQSYAKHSSAKKSLKYQGKKIDMSSGFKIDGQQITEKNNPALFTIIAYSSINGIKAGIEQLQFFIDNIKDYIKNNPNGKYVKEKKKDILMLQNAIKLSKDLTEEKGIVHKVEIPDDEYFMNESKFYNRQSVYIKKCLKNAIEFLGGSIEELLNSEPRRSDGKRDGVDIYNYIKQLVAIKYSKNENINSAKYASMALLKFGIKGIKYNNARNGICYVVFNPNDAKVIDKQITESSWYGNVNWQNNMDALGNVPATIGHNLFATMYPFQFLKLCPPYSYGDDDWFDKQVNERKPYGIPFLKVDVDEKNKQLIVTNHEGRHRVASVKRKEPNVDIPVAILYNKDRYTLPDINTLIKEWSIISQDGKNKFNIGQFSLYNEFPKASKYDLYDIYKNQSLSESAVQDKYKDQVQINDQWYNKIVIDQQFGDGTFDKLSIGDNVDFANDNITPASQHNQQTSHKSTHPQDSKIVLNDAFWNWFGNSKTIDSAGNPIICYHGSYTDITNFDRSFAGLTTGNNDARAFYFSIDPDVAEDYSIEAQVRGAEGEYYDLENPDKTYEEYEQEIRDFATDHIHTNPCFVKMENPYIYDYKHSEYNYTINNTIISACQGDWNSSGSEWWDEGIAYEIMQHFEIYDEENDEYVENPDAQPFDGVIFKNVKDNISTYGGSANYTDVYVVWEPKQIKSIYNKGLWSTESDNVFETEKEGK